ncbi:P-loop NTPase fold protein [Catellatospora sichuanensis]|uniref:P-loop NTPase fold protein n=1 Tax=Catellatospora sichuanensis TaxID=1969805 RepID=UPI0011828801|nr:P-loop NTPase fold protein [Catellatospora sichuanensis]
MSEALSESALLVPDQDLLGFSDQARKLAGFLRRVTLPFSVGVYGPWGAGKTSFANMLVHELNTQQGWEQLEVVRFSAWPYVSADLIWQALTERVAYNLCGCPAPAPADEDMAWRARLRRILHAPAFTLRLAAVDDPRERYERLVSRLAIAAGIASRTASERAGGPNAGRLLRLAADALTAVTTSPNPFTQLFDAGSGRPSPSLVQSIEEVRADLQELFERAADRKLVVIIDDLDRCLPEVALDVLETMKIFFFESSQVRAQCLFLIAADERVVARGLQVRLKDTDHVVGDSEARAYLEKIIQLGIPLPRPIPTRAHGLVAACAPEWAVGSDLLVEALDGNPRRIKQQSALLSYRYSTRTEHPTEGENRTRGMLILAFHKLTRLNALAPAAFETIRETATGDPAALKAWLSDHEKACTTEQFPPGDLAHALRTEPELRAAFLRPPVLSGIAHRALRVMLATAGAHPDADGTPQGNDPRLAYVIQTTLAEFETTSVLSLSTKYLHRVLRLRQDAREVFDELILRLKTGSDAFTRTTVALDRWLDDIIDQPDQKPALEAGTLPALCRELLRDPMNGAVLYDRPRISAIPVEYFGTVLPKAEPAVRGVADSRLKAMLTAATGLLGAAARIVLTAGVTTFPDTQLRLWLAQEIIDRRRFAKSELLCLRWPEIANWAYGPQALHRLHALEAIVVGGDRDLTLPARLQHITTDDRLGEFLAMPPALASSTAAVSGEPTALQVSATPSAPVASAAAERLNVAVAYEQLLLEVSPGSGAGQDSVASASIALGGNDPILVEIPLARIRELTDRLPWSSDGSRRLEDPDRAPATRDAIRRPRPAGLSAKEAITEIGKLLWTSTIGKDTNSARTMAQRLSAADRVRLTVRTQDQALIGLPWECLYLPSHRVLAGQTLKVSVIREVTEVARFVEPHIVGAVRILLITASPSDAPLPGADQEPIIVEQAMASALRLGAARLHVLQAATKQQLQHALREFAPHVVHFVGHGVIQNDQGFLVLLNTDGGPDPVAADEFGLMLQDHGIALAVLNGCLTGSAEVRDLAAGMAQRLVQQGVPAVIATTRTVLDTTAMRFAGEFYRAFADGYPAEAALVEARKALALQNRDWSTYIMYAHLGFPLHDLRIPVRDLPALFADPAAMPAISAPPVR